MYSEERDVEIVLTESELATAFYAIQREKERQTEYFGHEERGREKVEKIEGMMERIREQALEQNMKDPADNI